jgi:quercetin dioxygenase-like cupin family protein
MSRHEKQLRDPEAKIIKPTRRAVFDRSMDVALGGAMFGALNTMVGNAAAASQDGIRRIVTGHNAQGKSYVVSDSRIANGMVFWTGEKPLGPGAEGESDMLMPSTMPRLDPPLGGSACNYVRLPPNKPDTKPVWHRTMTIDYNILISGELVLMLEEGEVTLTGPGDTVVQRNTNHAWRNNSTTAPCIWVATLVPIPPRKA